MKDFITNVLDVLRSSIEHDYGGKVSPAEKAWGLSNAQLKAWLDGRKSPTLGYVGPIMDRLGITLHIPFEENPEGVDYSYVPKVEAKAGAGASLETGGAVEGLYAFRKDFLSRIGISAKNSVMMDVVGDSMEPLIMNGDTILIDRNDRDVIEGKIYAVTLGDELRVKYVFKGINGLILRSENKKYPDIPVNAADMESLVIQGRVRWFGRVI